MALKDFFKPDNLKTLGKDAAFGAAPYLGVAADVATALFGKSRVRPPVLADRNALGTIRGMDTTVDVRDQLESSDASYRALTASGGLGRNALMAAYGTRLRSDSGVMGERNRAEAGLRANRDKMLADATARYDLADMESKMGYRNDLEMRDAARSNLLRSGLQRFGDMTANARQVGLENEVALGVGLGSMTSDSARKTIMSLLSSSRNLSPSMRAMLQRMLNGTTAAPAAAATTGAPVNDSNTEDMLG